MIIFVPTLYLKLILVAKLLSCKKRGKGKVLNFLQFILQVFFSDFLFYPLFSIVVITLLIIFLKFLRRMISIYYTFFCNACNRRT